MDADRLFGRYRELQSYVGWADADAELIVAASGLLEPCLHELVDDFYAEIERHPAARKVITGGPAQVERLKETLVQWIRELLAGNYDVEYVTRRWRVGWRHVEIGLEQVYTNVALSRLRTGLIRVLHTHWQADLQGLKETVRALNKLLDLDLAIIEDAYQAEYAARLQRTERLATLGQVAGGVAHELRNPLNVIKTSVYYLLNARNPTPEKNGDHLKRIERNVELADNVITSLSNFAKVPIPALVPIAIEPFIRDVLDINPPGENIEVSIVCPAGLPHALGDADQLQIALGNLIRNARDAMPHGGRLEISAVANNGFLDLSVADTGSGIEPRDLARITEPLYSTKARGLGLGLAITRSIVEKNDGSLCITSEAGTRQHIHDPIDFITSGWRKTMTRGDAPRILVVDDDPDIRDNICDILSDLGYDVDAAGDGPAALELVSSQRYDVALLDLKMPGMDGLTLYRQIKKKRASIVSLLVTAFAGPTTTEEALSAGAWKVVAKPVDFPKLLSLVEEALDQPMVLVVDDDRDLCDNLWDLLRDRGFRIGLAHDLREAAAKLRESSFEVVLIDMRIPDGDGGSVFQLVRSMNPDARTVLVTGYRLDTDELIAQVIAEGADAVHYKPFDLPDLIETLRKLIRPRGESAAGGRQ